MRRVLLGLLLAFAMFPFASSLGASDAVQLQESDVHVPECAEVRTEAPYQAFGYTHIVVVRNGCEDTLRCQVATNVDPEWQTLTVPEGETGRVATRRGSPSREFEPRVRCET
ncbi:MAG: hypothetical protein AAGE52_26295 [Myxococcota bacterium]